MTDGFFGHPDEAGCLHRHRIQTEFWNKNEDSVPHPFLPQRNQTAAQEKQEEEKVRRVSMTEPEQKQPPESRDLVRRLQAGHTVRPVQFCHYSAFFLESLSESLELPLSRRATVAFTVSGMMVTFTCLPLAS